MTSDIVRSALVHIWRALGQSGCDRALMGGIALASWNHPRATRDVDLLIAIDRSDVVQLVDSLAEKGLRPKQRPALNVVGRHAFLHFLYTPPDAFYDVQLDLMLAESDFQRSALQRRVTRVVPGTEEKIAVVTCEDLLLFKLLSGRIIDHADAAMLLRENPTLDKAYLANWLIHLSLLDEAQIVWREAFPEEPFPF